MRGSQRPTVRANDPPTAIDGLRLSPRQVQTERLAIITDLVGLLCADREWVPRKAWPALDQAARALDLVQALVGEKT